MKNLHLLPTDKPSEEVWKDVISYEGLYQVSNFGNVKSLGNNFTRKERLLKLSPQSKGYLTVVLQKKCNKKECIVKKKLDRCLIDIMKLLHIEILKNGKYGLINNLKRNKWKIIQI